MLYSTPPEPWNQYQRIYLQNNHSTVKHYSLILARAGNLARASNLARAAKFSRAGRTFCATPLGLREPPELPSQAPGNPLHDPSGLPPTISENTASQLPRKGGYPQLQGRGYHSSPQLSGDISISHLGVSRGHRNVPLSSHCLYKATPHSSGLCRPLSRTLLLYNGSFRQDPLSLPGQSNYSPLAYLPNTTLYTPMCQIRTINT